MKKYKISISFILFIITATSLVQISLASESYVGIEEGDEYTWKVNIDEELADDILDDGEVYGPSTSDDIWEENDDFASANLTGEDQYKMLNFTDNDWFKIQCSNGDILGVELYFYYTYPLIYNLELQIYNSTGDLICYSNDTLMGLNPAWRQTIEIRCNYTGLYYILVTNETVDQSILYDLYIDIDHYHPPPPPFDYRGYLESFVEDYYDYEGVRIKVNKIKDESSYKINGKWVKGVKVKCEIYKTKEFDNEEKWKEHKDITDFVIVDSDESYYHRFLGFIIADDVDWGDVADDVEKDYAESKALYPTNAGTYAYDFKDVEADDDENGLTINIELINDDMDDIEVIIEYTDKGVLELGEMNYGGVNVMSIELEKGFIEEIFDNPLVLAGIVGSIIAVIAAAGIFIFLRRRKRRL